MVSEISQNLTSTHEVLNFLVDWLVALEAGRGVGATSLAGEHVVAWTVEYAAQIFVTYDAHSLLNENGLFWKKVVVFKLVFSVKSPHVSEDKTDANNGSNHKAREQHGLFQKHVLKILEHSGQIRGHDEWLIAAYLFA